MGVLNIKDRIVPGLLDHLGEVEVQCGVVLAGQHDEAKDVLADLADHVAERHDAPGPLRHLQRLAAIHQVDQLAEANVERCLAAAQAP